MNIFYNLIIRSGSNKVEIFPDSAISADYNFVLPATAPTNGFFLVWNDTKQALEWSDTSSLSSPSTESSTFTINNDLTGSDTPTENCSYVVNRGQEDNAVLTWDETLDKWVIGTTGNTKPVSTNYTATFGNVDIVANVLTINHNLNGNPNVTIIDNNNIGIGMSPTYTNSNTFTLDFTRIGTITGVWKITATL